MRVVTLAIMAFLEHEKPVTKVITPPRIGWSILGPTLAVTFLATLAISLRLYTRRLVIHKLCREDYLMAFCMLLSWANTSVIIAGRT